jgi:hypothetical protein
MAASEGGAGDDAGHPHVDIGADLEVDFEMDLDVIERAVLNETEEGRQIQAAFIAQFGEFVRDSVRPVLREVAGQGGQPQLLVNALAELMRVVADSIEFPLDHPRSGYPPHLPAGNAG